jgi:electron transfer flavoprotein alpha subunit
MSGIRRINPRRPFRITPQGIRRIVLGEEGEAGEITLSPVAMAASKPLRLVGEATATLLVVAHSDRGALDGSAREAIAAAAILADPATAVLVLVLGDLAEDLGPLGADRILVVPECGNGAFLPDLEVSVLSDVIDRFQPRHVLMPDSPTGTGDLGRRTAAALDAEIATHVVELKPDTVACYRQGGTMLARRGLPRFILLDPGAIDASLPLRGASERLDYAAHAVAPGLYRDLGLKPVAGAALPLQEADFIVAAGNGVRDVPTLEAVADLFGAAIGASRVAVDDGRFPRDQQVGATGKTVQASVYMAIGISGAVQHLQGIRACRHVIAINSDASAPIARRADLTIVADAQAVMQALVSETAKPNWPGDTVDEARTDG